MTDRAFPVVFASSVKATTEFYERLGFIRHFQLPADDDDPGYVGLRRGTAELAIVDAAWPADQYARPVGTGPRFEMFVYVNDIDRTIDQFGDTINVLRPPAIMPWGERVAFVTDPDGNPVALATPPAQPS
jgi:lactoylglutathione lyase